MLKYLFRLMISTILFSIIYSGQQSSFSFSTNINDHKILTFQLEEQNIRNENGISNILPDHQAKTMEVGSPALPVFSTFFIKEPGKDYTFDIQINHSQVFEDIIPNSVQPLTETMEEINSVDAITDYSNRHGQYPDRILSVSPVLNMRGNEIIQLRLVPYRYNFDHSTLEQYDDVEIIVNESIVTDEFPEPTHKRSRAFDPILSSMSVNFSPAVDEDYQQPAILYICGGNSLANPIFQSLIEWRREQGIIVYTASTGEIGNDQTQIKSYIQNAYNTFDPPPEFVGLVGDNGGSYNIPTYFEDWSTCSYNSPCYGEGDYPYSQLEGNDILPEVLIGRLSVRNTTDLSIVAAKTIDYERGVSADEGWFEKAGFGANPDVSGTGLSIVITNEYLHELVQSYGMENSSLMVRNTAPQISVWLNGQLSSGVSYLNFRGLYGPASFDTEMIFNNLSIRPILPLVTFITCGTGSFAYEVAAPIERFIRSGVSPANYSGGVAAIGTATYGTHTPFNNIIDMGIYHGIFAQGAETAGAALAFGELAMLNTYPSNPNHYVDIFTHWNNLMGDPALRLWTDTPDSLILQHPSLLNSSSNYFPVTVTDYNGSPVQDAAVGILFESEETPSLGYTDQNGFVSFSDINNSSQNFTVTATKRNYFPQQEVVDIISDDHQFQLNGSPEILDDITGNGDGVLNPGEDAQISVNLNYSGPPIQTPVDIYLESTSQFIEMEDDPVSFSNINDGSNLQCTFDISVLPDATNLDNLNFQVWIPEGSTGDYYLQFTLTVLGPQLIVTQTLPGDLDMVFPGDQVSLPIVLSNLGLADTGDITGELSAVQPEIVNILDETCTWNSIAPGGISAANNEPLIEIWPHSVNGTVTTLILTLSGTSGIETQIEFNLQIGTSGMGEPVGPDNYGYYVYGIEDQYSLSPGYFWIEIDPHYGGDGEPLSMVDCGVGIPYNQSNEIIDLPFPFTFYGVEYNTISVSTNGWLSLGETDLESFRNTPVPGPGGPAPIIAAFWDDLKTKGTNGGCNGTLYGDVYYFEDPAGKFVIIEWSDMKTYLNDDDNTFQIILFNTREFTSSGDSEVLIQYKEFNNTSEGIYLPGYQGLVHGSFATIGFEDHTQAGGIQYTFNNVYAENAGSLHNESSLFFTTRLPDDLFFSDTNFGEPPLTVNFQAFETGEGIINYWDVNNDGNMDASGNSINYTFSDYGYYTIRMMQDKNGIQTTDYKLNYILVVPFGCTDPVAENYDPDAEYNDGTCEYTWGCMDPTAANYNENATQDDGDCYYMNYQDISVDNIYFNARLGCDVAIEDQIALAGAFNDSVGNLMSTGGAYIFEQNEYGGWENVRKLTAFDAQSLDYFGYSVSLSGNVAAIGSYKDDNEMGYDAGSVYIFRRDSYGVWQFEQKITASDGSPSDNFGYSLKVLNDNLVVGSRKCDIGDNNNQGAVYFYEFVPGTGWLLNQKIVAADGQAGDSFGASVDMTSQLMVVGANLADYGNNTNTGRSYVFENLSGDNWIERQELLPAGSASQEQFGYAVSITDNLIAVSKPFANSQGYSNGGAVVIYHKPVDTWIVDRYLESDHPGINENFGLDLNIQEPYLAIHSGNNLVIVRKEPDLQWVVEADFQSTVVGPLDFDGGRLFTGEQITNTGRIYAIDEWEDWLDVPGPGDLNNDSQVDILDIIILVSYIMDEIELSPDQINSGEVTGDGNIDILDIVYLINFILGE